MKFVLITLQPGAIGGAEDNAYECTSQADAEGLGHLLADGAEPPMRTLVLPLQPPPDVA